MRSIKLFGIVLFFLLIPLNSYADESENVEEEEWGVFVNNPTEENYFALGKLISQCEKGNEECEHLLSPHYTSSQKLFDLVKLGNRKAIDITFASIRVLDGGELGDAMRSLGYLIESDPELFFKEIRMHGISSLTMERIVIKTPLELTDQFDLQLEVLRKRLQILSSLHVDDPFLASYHYKAIKSIQGEINFRKKIHKD